MANYERGRGDRGADRDRDADRDRRPGDDFSRDRGRDDWRRGYGAEGPEQNWNRNVAYGHGREDHSGDEWQRGRGDQTDRYAGDYRSAVGRHDRYEERRDPRRDSGRESDRDGFGPDYLRDYAPVDRERDASRYGTVGPRGFGSSAGYPGNREASRSTYPETSRDYTRPLDRPRDDERRSGRDVWSRASEAVASAFGEPEGDRWRRDPDEPAGHRGRGPKGYARSDARIREDINERLAYDSWVDASEIEVTVTNGDVTLAGNVDGRDARRRAEGIAERVSGVLHVNNNLRVNRNTDHPTGPDKSWRGV